MALLSRTFIPDTSIVQYLRLVGDDLSDRMLVFLGMFAVELLNVQHLC